MLRAGLCSADATCPDRRHDDDRRSPRRYTAQADEGVRRQPTTDHPREEHRQRDHHSERDRPRCLHGAPLDFAAAGTQSRIPEAAGGRRSGVFRGSKKTGRSCRSLHTGSPGSQSTPPPAETNRSLGCGRSRLLQPSPQGPRFRPAPRSRRPRRNERRLSARPRRTLRRSSGRFQGKCR